MRIKSLRFNNGKCNLAQIRGHKQPACWETDWTLQHHGACWRLHLDESGYISHLTPHLTITQKKCCFTTDKSIIDELALLCHLRNSVIFFLHAVSYNSWLIMTKWWLWFALTSWWSGVVPPSGISNKLAFMATIKDANSDKFWLNLLLIARQKRFRAIPVNSFLPRYDALKRKQIHRKHRQQQKLLRSHL